MVSSHKPTLGVHLLETITKGMYSEPLHTIREYVQNAYDSIRTARRDRLLNPSEGEVQIRIDPDARTVRIRDNGTGLEPEEAAVYLLDLGNSAKAGTDAGLIENAGFRGIGRMAGITYCKMLRFETSNGFGKKCIVKFDAAGINRLTRAGQKATTIVDAVSSNSEIAEEIENPEAHYLEVVLEEINKEGEQFLNRNRVADYLAQIAPVDYDPVVWSHRKKIHSFAQKAESESSLDHVRITIRDAEGNLQRDVRRPFKDTFETINKRRSKRTVRVKDVVALPVDGNPVNGWWGWLALHERQGALEDIPYAGLRIRMHNIAIGDDSITRDLFKTSSHARWCFGEIHITDHRLTPNTQRDNFEDSIAWTHIKEHLRSEAVLIGKDIRRESDQRNKSIENLERRAEKSWKSADKAIQRGFVSPDEQRKVAQELREEAETLEQRAGKRNCPEEEKERLCKVRRELEEAAERVAAVKTTKADEAQAHLSRETRRALRKVRQILQAELDEETFRRIIEKVNVALQPGRRN